MKLDYGTQLSYEPIMLSIGTLRKPTLREISKLSFDNFNIFESFLKMTPEFFYETFNGDEGKEYWNTLPEEQQNNITLYDVIKKDAKLQKIYVEIFNFFFIENVVFEEELFILLNQEVKNTSDFKIDDIKGIIHKDTFMQILNIIQQICCIAEKEESTNNVKFKNSIAKKLFEKMQKDNKNKKKKADVNLTLPNLISAVSNTHPSINPTNVWDLTIFQLHDSFSRLNSNIIFDIERRRVSVWGDEKKTFKISGWYTNQYDH